MSASASPRDSPCACDGHTAFLLKDETRVVLSQMCPEARQQDTLVRRDGDREKQGFLSSSPLCF